MIEEPTAPVDSLIDSSPRPTPAAIITFVIAALVLPCAICSGQYLSWFLEQLGIISASMGGLVHSGKVTQIAQGIVLLAVSAPFFIFSRNSLRPIYQGWLIASLFTFPALVLRFVDANQDQLGSLIQIALGLTASAVAFFVRRSQLQFNPAPGGVNPRNTLAALAAVPLTVWPFLVWGAPGSISDALLNLLAGLSLGLLAATLVSVTAGNFLLNSLGVSTLLCILGSAFGYDGSQVMLVTLLPACAFAVAALSPSVAGVAVAIGLLAAAPLMLVDPTELAIVLGDFGPWAARAGALMILNGLIVGLALWAVGKWQSRPRTAALPGIAALIAWVAGAIVFFAFGIGGNHGDRLFVIFRDQGDLSPAHQIADRNERLAYVYRYLTDHADQTQAGVRETLDRFGIRYKPYYLVNAIEVEGGALVRLYLATRPEVDRVIPSPRLRPLPEPVPPSPGPYSQIPESFELSYGGTASPDWSARFIGADKVWKEFGVTGQGIIVGQSDSGVDGDHPALHDSYRGLSTGDAYNWYDPWEGTTAPNDEGGHGTHTLGSILGSGGFGVAPGAQWMGCVNLNRNLANPALYLECMQFLLAPFPPGGDPLRDGDPTQAAHVLNNSWGCPPIEGCDADALKPAVENLRAAGIFVVVSTGNDGPICETVNTPLALYDSVFSVAAVDARGNLADFSSRGPVTADGSGRMKPDIAAPGVDVFSSLPGATYGANSGTSMAGPHVVGVVALLWSAQPDLVGDIDRTEQIIIDTAQPYSGFIRELGGCEDLPLPNNGVGYGIVDAYAAVKEALGR